MPRPSLLRVAALVTGGAAVAALSVGPTVAPSVAPSAGSPSTSTDRVELASYPTNAGKVFRWGNAQWADDFIGPVKRMWSQNKPGLIDNQHGMLTINGTGHSGTVAATLTGHGRTVGRWEARVRAEQYTRRYTPFKVVWELIPTGAYHCGARSIVLASYPLGSSRAHMAVHNGHAQFTAGKKRDLSAGPFHTYAVEVTRNHVSWFVDTHVIRTERRPEALSGAELKVRFRLVAQPGHRMNPGRMQMDWVRYYSLQRKNARSIDAPALRRSSYAAAC